MAIVADTLVPAVARLQREPADAHCQANLARITEAMAFYLYDNYGRFPTNRAFIGGGTSLGPVIATVKLSPDPVVQKFRYGVNWVEALYTYTKDRADRTDCAEASFCGMPERIERDISG